MVKCNGLMLVFSHHKIVKCQWTFDWKIKFQSSNHLRMGILVQSLLGFHHAFFDTSTYTMETIKRQKKYLWVIFNTTKSTKQPKRFSEGQTKACLDMSYYNHIFKTIHLVNLQQKYSQGQRTSSVNSFATIVNG